MIFGNAEPESITGKPNFGLFNVLKIHQAAESSLGVTCPVI